MIYKDDDEFVCILKPCAHPDTHEGVLVMHCVHRVTGMNSCSAVESAMLIEHGSQYLVNLMSYLMSKVNKEIQ